MRMAPTEEETKAKSLGRREDRPGRASYVQEKKGYRAALLTLSTKGSRSL